jgi:hypothetical protein
LKKHNTNILKQLNNLLMESRLRILRWLSLLLLSAGLVGWSRGTPDGTLYRRLDLRQNHPKIFSLKNSKQQLQTFNRTMKIQLRIRRWLSLLLLSEGVQWQSHNLAHISWFRRPQKHLNTRYKS